MSKGMRHYGMSKDDGYPKSWFPHFSWALCFGNLPESVSGKGEVNC